MKGFISILNILALIAATRAWGSTRNVAAPPNALAIGQDGNGGDPLGLEFDASARAAIEGVKNDPGHFPKLQSVDLQKILTASKVLVVDVSLSALLGHATQESVAVNLRSSGVIFLNRARWIDMQNEVVRQALALHELLGLAGLEQTGVYTYSQVYLEVRKVQCETDLCSTTPIYQCNLYLQSGSKSTSMASGHLDIDPKGSNIELDGGSAIKAEVNVANFEGSSNFGIQIYQHTASGDVLEASVAQPSTEFPSALNLTWSETNEDREWIVSCLQQ